jgi:hypothetical protein
MLTFENFCNLERLAVVTSTSKKARSRASCKTFLVAATDDSITMAAGTIFVIIISRSMATNVSSSTMRIVNIFMERSLGGRLVNYFTTPFLLASEGVICEEVEPWEENHQKWRAWMNWWWRSILCEQPVINYLI